MTADHYASHFLAQSNRNQRPAQVRHAAHRHRRIAPPTRRKRDQDRGGPRIPGTQLLRFQGEICRAIDSPASYRGRGDLRLMPSLLESHLFARTNSATRCTSATICFTSSSVSSRPARRPKKTRPSPATSFVSSRMTERTALRSSCVRAMVLVSCRAQRAGKSCS